MTELGLMHRWGVRGRLLVLALLPCLVTIGLMAGFAWDQRARAAEAADFAGVVRLVVAIGDLLHETQKERGASSVFMSSRGTKFVAELPAQRQLTDARRRAYFEFVRRNSSRWPAEVGSAIDMANAQLADIEGRRREVSGLGRPVLEVVAYYTELNDRLLDSAASLAARGTDGGLRGLSTSYWTFLQAKEKTGLERAQLSNVFGTDKFAPGQYLVVSSLIAAQRSFLRVFTATAPATTIAFLKARMTAPEVAEVERIEQLALDRPTGTFGVDSSAWFKTMTVKINLMKEVEDALSHAVLERAQTIQDEASGALKRVAIVGLALLLFTSLIGAALAVSIVRPLDRLTALANQIATGNGTAARLATDGPPEMVALATSVNHLLDSHRLSRHVAPTGAMPAASPGGRVTGSRRIVNRQ